MTARVVLAGNNHAAVEVLGLLIDALPLDQLLVLAPEGDKKPGWQVSLVDTARELRIECLTPSNVNSADVLSRVRDRRPDLLLSVYYTQLFRPEFLELIAGPRLNFHPSLLPRHRGVAPLIWAIAEGDRMAGVTVHHIDAGIDTGAVVLQHPLPIHPDDTGYELHLKLAKLVKAACVEILRGYLSTRQIPPGTEQSGTGSQHTRSDPALNHIDWTWPRERVRNVVRALAPPLPGAYAMLDDAQVVLARVDLAEVAGTTPKPPGMVELVRGEAPLVWASDGPVRLTSVVGDPAFHEGQILA